MSKRIYLDYAAAVPLRSEIKKAVDEAETKTFANASSLHQEGREARAIIDQARFDIASKLNIKTNEIIFTSGATESNALALYGVTEYAKSRGLKPHVIISKIEHSGVIEYAANLEHAGVEVSWLSVDAQGLVNETELESLIQDNTVLVSVMLVNNETGVLNDVAALVRKVKAKNPQILFHTDASQALGWIDFSITDLNVDLLSLSSYKIGGPKGVGLLFAKSGTKIMPMMPGTQEWGKRAGTEPVGLIAGFVKALNLISEWSVDEVRVRRDNLVKNILTSIPDSICSTSLQSSASHIAHFSFAGVDSQLLTIALDRAGLAASPGSACSSGAVNTSHVVKALGIDVEKYSGHLRLSLGIDTTDEELDRALEIIKNTVADLRASTTFDSK